MNMKMSIARSCAKPPCAVSTMIKVSNFKRYATILLLGLCLCSRVYATSWGLNSFSDSVYWSDCIAVGKVTKVIKTDQKPGMGQPLSIADITVQVLEPLKGSLPDKIRVTDVDMGDTTTMSSPYLPLPKEIVGRKLLLFLNATDRKGLYKAYMRFLVENDSVRHIAFASFSADRYPIVDIRAMIAQLTLIQTACPRDISKVKNEEAALAACWTALYSQYDHVVWYGARRLLDRDIPKDFLPDLIRLFKHCEREYPVRYLLVQCMAKTRDIKNVPVLIDALENKPKDVYIVNALQDLTGEKFGSNLNKWRVWWKGQGEGKQDAVIPNTVVDETTGMNGYRPKDGRPMGYFEQHGLIFGIFGSWAGFIAFLSTLPILIIACIPNRAYKRKKFSRTWPVSAVAIGIVIGIWCLGVDKSIGSSDVPGGFSALTYEYTVGILDSLIGAGIGGVLGLALGFLVPHVVSRAISNLARFTHIAGSRKTQP